MKTKKILLVCACVMVFGLLLATAGYFSGASLSVAFGWNGTQIQSGTPHTIQQDHLNAFDSIDLNVDQGRTELIPSDHYGVHIQYYGDNDHYASEINNGTLTITEDNNDSNGMNLNIGFIGTRKNTIQVYYPKNSTFQYLKLKNRYGDLKASSLQSAKTNIELSFGKLELEDTVCGSTVLSQNNGDCRLNKVQASSLELRNDFGKSTLDNITLPADSKSLITSQNGSVLISELTGGVLTLNDDFGEVTLRSIQLAGLKSKLNNGGFHLSGSTVQNSDIQNSFGSIDIDTLISSGTNVTCKNGSIHLSGELKGKNIIHSDFGAVDVTTSLPLREYGYDVSSKFGSVRVNGQEYKQAVIAQSSGTANSLSATSSNGDVSINFKG